MKLLLVMIVILVVAVTTLGGVYFGFSFTFYFDYQGKIITSTCFTDCRSYSSVYRFKISVKYHESVYFYRIKRLHSYHLVVFPCEDLPSPCEGIKRWHDEEHACKDEEMHKMCPVSVMF